MTFRRRRLLRSEPVEVYRNLQRGGYSIRQRGRVVAHADEVALALAIFHVSEAGRQRVLATGHKNVHAWIRGVLIGPPCLPLERSVRYNPRTGATFVDDRGRPVHAAPIVTIDRTGVRITS